MGADRGVCGAGATGGGAVPDDFGAWATIGLHPHDASQGVEEVERALEDASPSSARRRGGGGGVRVSTTTTTTRPGPRNATPSPPRSRWRARHDLTLVVHTRDAWDDTLDILRAAGRTERTVMHCFTGGPDEARRCLDLGAFLSFSGIVTFKSADDVRAAAALCPLDRLLVETDAPFLAPVPHRGKQNRPAWVVAVGEAVSEIKRVAPSSLAETSTATTRAAFALS